MENPIVYTPIQVESAVRDNEAMWLFEQAQQMDSVIEIGSYRGKSTHALLSGCKGTVYAVDHFQGNTDPQDGTHGKSGKADFLHNVGHFSNLHLLEMPSSQAALQFEPKSVDMVFIDGGHLYDEIVMDLCLWVPRAKRLVCGHDSGYGSIQKALSDLGLDWCRATGTLWRLT